MADIMPETGETMESLAEWAEKAGFESLKSRHENLASIKKEGATTLTVLLAGATGALAYGAKGLENGAIWLAAGSGAFALHLYLLSMLLVLWVLKVRSFPALHNSPMALYQPDYSLDEMRVASLKGIEARISEAVEIVNEVADNLNYIRIGAVASPITFIVVSAVWEFVLVRVVAGG